MRSRTKTIVDKAAFADKSHRPNEKDLATALGPSNRFWESFLALIRKLDPRATAEWKYYAGGGWRYVARDKGRNLVYLRPSIKRFTASFAFSDKAVAAAAQSDLPPRIVKPLRDSPKYPEGRAVRIDVTSVLSAKIAGKLLAIKVAN